MKLVKNRKGSSFFEAFSDLIFATMAIFVLLLVIVLSQVNPKAPKALYITGGSQPTYSLISHANVAAEPSVVFFPIEVADQLNLARSLEKNDPLLRLCESASSEDGIVHISMDRYVSMATGFSPEFAAGIRSQGEGTIEASLLINEVLGHRDVSHLLGEQLKAKVFLSEQLRVVGGSNDDSELGLDAGFIKRYEESLVWLQQLENGNFHSWLSRSRTPVREQASVVSNGFAMVVACAKRPDVIQIGRAELSAREFRGFLRSIQPGSDFALRFVDELGEPVDPPDWLVDGSLKPSGYVARF